MPKVYFLQGLPGSGKSYWAKQLVDQSNGKIKRANKDDLRLLMDNGKFNKASEKLIVAVERSIVEQALAAGFSVIVDNTHFNPAHEDFYRGLAAKYTAGFEVKTFFDTPLEECIRRDLARPQSVGAEVIKRMYNQYLAPQVEPYKAPEGVPTATVSDIDGSLALFGNANPYERDFTKDEVSTPVAQLLRDASARGDTVILVSGRKEDFREQTERWLGMHFISYDYLYMRPSGDSRSDVLIKQEIFENHIRGKYRVRFIIDDRPRIIRLWKSLGIFVLNVGDDVEF